jgi:hypothetical protein
MTKLLRVKIIKDIFLTKVKSFLQGGNAGATRCHPILSTDFEEGLIQPLFKFCDFF